MIRVMFSFAMGKLKMQNKLNLSFAVKSAFVHIRHLQRGTDAFLYPRHYPQDELEFGLLMIPFHAPA